MKTLRLLLLAVTACSPTMPSEPPPVAQVTRAAVAARARSLAGEGAVACGTVPSTVSEHQAHRCAIALLDSAVSFFVVFENRQVGFDVTAPFALVGSPSQELKVVTAAKTIHCAAPGLSVTPPGGVVDNIGEPPLRNIERLRCLNEQEKKHPVAVTHSMIHPHRVSRSTTNARRLFVAILISESGEVESITPIRPLTASLTGEEQARLDEAKQTLRFTPAWQFGRPVRAQYFTVLDASTGLPLN